MLNLQKYLNCIFLILFFLFLNLSAEVKVSRAKLRVGSSVRLKENTNATLSCYIENPDQSTHQLRIVFMEEANFTPEKKNYFYDTVKVPPNCAFTYSSEVKIGKREKYILNVYIDGQKSSGLAEGVDFRVFNRKKNQLALINDSFDRSLGAFLQNDLFDKNYYATIMNCRDIPDNWTGLKDMCTVVIIDADFDKFTDAQFKAVKEYVAYGGNLLFAHPDLIFKAEKTPLAELLPVIPVKFTVLEKFPELADYFDIPEKDAEHDFNFLFSVPKDEGVTFLKKNAYPVFRWKKYGLGTVRFSAVPIIAKDFLNKKLWTRTLKFFISDTPRFSNTENVRSTLNEMSGFSIPGTGRVKTLLLVYFTIFAIIMIGGYYLKKSTGAWGISFIYSIIAAVVFVLSASTGEKDKFFSGFEFIFHSEGNSPEEAYYSVFSNKSEELSLSGINSGDFFSSVPKITDSVVGLSFGKNGVNKSKSSSSLQGMQEPFVVRRNASGIQELQDFKIWPKTPMFFRFLSKSSSKKNRIKFDYPEMNISNKGSSLDWLPPEKIQFDKAFAVFPDKAFNLYSENGELNYSSEISSDSQTDIITANIKKTLENTVRKTTSFIALVSNTEKSIVNSPDDYEKQLKKIDIFPVHTLCKNKKIKINNEMIVFSAGETASRMIMPAGKLLDSFIPRSSGEYLFRFYPPPEFLSIKPGKIIVNFSYVNDGQNISITPYLKINGQKIAADRIDGSRYIFENPKLEKAIQKYNKSGLIILEFKEKHTGMNILRKQKLNKWQLLDFSMEIIGEIPEEIIPFTY